MHFRIAQGRTAVGEEQRGGLGGTTAQSWVREQDNPGTGNDHTESLYANQPRTGYVFHPAGSSSTSAGVVIHYDEYTAMALRGTGVSVLVLPALFELSLGQP